MIDVDTWGIGGAVVDGGRPGRAWVGAPRGGAVDLVSLALANRLVGNPEHAPAIETSGGLSLTTAAPVMVAVTGALVATTVSGGPPVGWGVPVVLPPGARLRFGRLLDGARAYVAVRGGVHVDRGRLVAGPDPHVPAADHPAARREHPGSVRLWPGPRLDHFAPGTWQQLLAASFTVTTTSRVGCRLTGPALRRVVTSELPSEGMVEGAVQVPPDGNPIIMLADHPVTGGYPVVAVVDPSDLHHVAQLAPGAPLRFRPARPPVHLMP